MTKYPWVSLFLFLILGGAWSQNPAPLPNLAVTPAPGTYTGLVSVNVQAPPGALVRYRFLESAGNQAFPWTGPLSLDALDGETRVYTLRLTTDFSTGESQTRDYRFLIVKPANKGATVSPPPGAYTSAVKIAAVLPAGWSLVSEGKPVSPTRILDSAQGDRKTFHLEALGPKKEVLDWTYTVDRRDQELLSLDLVSPVPGVWANAQTLAAVFRGVDKVLWSWGDHLDLAHSQVYTGPVLLDRSGVQTLTLAGRSRTDGRWVEKTVKWTNGSEPVPLDGWPESGVQGRGVDLPEADGWDLSWDEGRSWQPSEAVHQEPLSTVSRKVLAVQVRKDSQLYRYLYWIDSRVPSEPVLQFYGGWNPRVTFSGSVESLHRITWTRADGQSVEDPEALWGPSGSWKVPDGVVSGRVQVLGLNGLSGEPAAVGFSETGWSTPEWEPWDLHGPQTDKTALPLGGRVLPRPGFWAVYEISDKPDVAEPGAKSPWLDGAFLPGVPWGADRTFYARFAWRDAGGLTGPATPVVAVRVDRIPPGPPAVSLTGGQITVKPAEGEEPGTTLFWAVTPGRVTSAEGLNFQPYRHVLDLSSLRTGSPGALWFHVQAQDRAGNTGPARLNVVLTPPDTGAAPSLIQVDPDPAVGESTVADRGVYPWPQFRLRAPGADRDLWVGVEEGGAAVPDDWKNRLQAWTGVLARTVSQGERQSFLVYWNVKTADGWAWSTPKSLVLTLDQGPPAAPVGPTVRPQGPQKDPWTMEVHPGQSGDTLKYTYTLDGSTPADPTVSGEPWNGARTWDAPPAGKVVVRVRFAAYSVSGLSILIPEGEPLTIDRVSPVPVDLGLAPFTFQTGPVNLPLAVASGTIHYSLSTDGTPPSIPNDQSPTVSPAGLTLDGTPGQSTLYRLRLRPFSSSGIPGTAGDTYTVLVDRTGQSPVTGGPSLPSAGPTPLPSLTGLPPGGISAVPVVLQAVWPVGSLRFELWEGTGAPRSVTDQSPRWDQDLVLDGGQGVDRSFGVGIRGFSPDGTPITPEVQYQVRVDRAVPGAPVLVLQADPQRPEVSLHLADPTPNPELVLQYRWFWETFPQGSGQEDWKTLTASPPVFSAPGGALTRLRVQAFFRDEAGNEGPMAEEAILVDQNVVYLSSDGQGDGTRGNPAGSVSAAVDLARRGGKTILFAAAGTYPVSQTVDLGGFEVYGGLTSDIWDGTQSPQRSVWTAQAPFKGASLVESGPRGWTLFGVDLTAQGVPLNQVVLVQGAKVVVKNSVWTWSGTRLGWNQTGGSVDWTSVSGQYEAQPQGTFLDLKSVQASLKSFELAASLNHGGILVNLDDCQALVQDLVIISKKALDFDGIWSSSKGKLTVDQARILAGEGASRATAFLLKDTEATFWNTEVDLYAEGSNTGFQTSGGQLELEKSTLNILKGSEFNQGIVVDRGQTILRDLNLRVGSGAYQGGLELGGGSLTMGTCMVQLAGGGHQVWGAHFVESCLVTMNDVTWKLEAKTPGDLWIIAKPWTAGSKVDGSLTPGW